jgi:Ca2+-binding RTX toxin-like protein
MAQLIYNTAGNTGFDMRSLDLDALIAGKTVTAFNPVIIQWKDSVTLATVNLLGQDLNATVSGGALTGLTGTLLTQVWVPNLAGTEFGLNITGLTASVAEFFDFVQAKDWVGLADFVRVGDDTVIGTKNNDTLLGGDGNDSFVSNQGADIIKGGGGNDTLNAMGGHDVMTGGQGADAFRFELEPVLGEDWSVKIKDFRHGVDRIEIAEILLLGGDFAAGPMGAQHFHIGREATTSGHSVIYNKARGLLYFDDDGVGGIEKVLLAKLGAGTVLTLDDLWII